ncbi:MAG: DUF748 domain-containing protein [Xanthomonadales bacterium]|nr:DUF748 domain-containing protein [Xanthomonadales bacterium]
MTTIEKAAPDTGHSSRKTIKNHWLSPRRKRFWIILLILLYTLLGFFAAPTLIRNSVTALLQEDLGRAASIGKIKVNPYALSLRIQDFRLDDRDGVRLAAFDGFYVNFQFLSILKWAWTFSQVELYNPYIHFERLANGELRVTRFLQDFASLHPPETDLAQQAEEPGKVPRLLIRNLVLQNGRMDAVDNLPATPVELKLSPININIQELNTIPDLHGRQQVVIRLPGNAKLEWNGSLSLAPLESSGELSLQGLQIDPVLAYLENLLPLEAIRASLSAGFKYHVTQGADELSLDIDELDITLDDLLVNGLAPATNFVVAKQVSLRDGKLRYPEKSLHFGKLNIRNPEFTAWLNEDGSPSVMELVPKPGKPAEITEEPGRDTASLPWRLGIGEFTLDSGRISLSDRSIQPNAAVELTRLSSRINGINNEPGVLMPFELSGSLGGGGTYSLDGELGVLPGLSLSAAISTGDIPLSLAQPYAQQFAHILIGGGVLNSRLELALPAGEKLSLGGSLQVPGLEVGETLGQEKLLGWATLDIDRFDLDGKTLHISQLDLEKPYGRMVVFEDMSTNVANIVKPATGDMPPPADAEAMEIVIGGISVNQGLMDFADFSLPLPFATHITGLDGSISTIATESTEPANIQLEGQVDEYGLARIGGSMNMLDPVQHTDVTLEFRNLLMSSLSPYTVAFAGRKIAQGALDLGLVYRIDEGQLHGDNDIVLSDLVLGEKVDHPDAASLPLGLAVSLLKDADGVIRIDLPVEGDVNDPEFKIGGVIWKAFTGLITKLVSAPFKLLGNLIGVESEDFGQFEFLAGRSDLTPPEMEKVAQLVEALQKRPELGIEINGVWNRGTDVPALKLARLRDTLSQRLGSNLGEWQENNMMLDDGMQAAVESLFTERFPDTPLESLKSAHTAPPADDPDGKPVFDQLAYATDLWNRLQEAEVVSDGELTTLANQRAEAIHNAFLAEGSIGPERVTIGEPVAADSGDGEWVKLELKVASG